MRQPAFAPWSLWDISIVRFFVQLLFCVTHKNLYSLASETMNGVNVLHIFGMTAISRMARTFRNSNLGRPFLIFTLALDTSRMGRLRLFRIWSNFGMG